MDDIRPPRRGAPSYTPRTGTHPDQIYGQSTNPSQQPMEHEQDQSDYAQPHEDYHLPDGKKKSGKGVKVALVLFILLFIVAAAFAAYLYFVEMVSMQQDIDDLKEDNARLVQQIRSLEYDNRDLQQKLILEQQKTQAASAAEVNETQ